MQLLAKHAHSYLMASFVCAVISATLANTEPMAVVRQYVDAFNKGDADAMAATCADPTSVLDGLVPHIWLGSTACRD